ncbi:MAG: aldo/keto reductase, partial [Alphaproteobacteria bacterium]|nr:aldo/keto reductase [Alphaproteobacteria bacterium]
MKTSYIISGLALLAVIGAATIFCCNLHKTTGAKMGKSIYAETIKLNDGNRIPQMGIGTYNDGGDENARRAVLHALQNGVRMIDTAHAYQDERGVGQAVKESGIPRSEIWITSKLWPSDYKTAADVLPSIDKMLERLGTDYVDLLLIHQPVGDTVATWREMEKAVKSGKVRSIGLSNFEYFGLDEVMNVATIKPSVMQVECHPYYQQRDTAEKIAKYDMKMECWFPLGGAGKGNQTLFNDPVIVEIAKAHGKTPAQVILRWHMQMGYITMPGSIVDWQIEENININD